MGDAAMAQMSTRIPHNRLTFGQEEVDAAASAVASGWWVSGRESAAFESEIACATSRNSAVSVGSGFAALRLGLVSLGVAEDDEVIVPAYCCVALVNAVMSIGARAVPADIDEDWNLAADAVRSAITKKTRAIIAVHTFGAPANLDALAQLGVPVVEDCSHGFGEIGNEAVLGSQADVAVISLHATKFTGCGEGGVVLANGPDIAERVRDLRDYTDKRPSALRMNDKISDIEAAIARCQLRRLKSICQAREERSKRYDEALQGLEAGGLLRRPSRGRPRIWYRYAIEVTQGRLEKLSERLRSRGVDTAQPVDNWHSGDIRSWPRSRHAYQSLLSLPLYPTLQPDEQDRVIEEMVSAAEDLA